MRMRDEVRRVPTSLPQVRRQQMARSFRRTEGVTDELVQERRDFRAFREAAWAELARKDEEHAAVLAGMAAAIAKRDDALRRVAWARWLDERATFLVGCLALLWDALTAPKVRQVGRAYGPSSGQLAGLCGVLVALAVIALFGLVG